jgi:hypothetical protein
MAAHRFHTQLGTASPNKVDPGAQAPDAGAVAD